MIAQHNAPKTNQRVLFIFIIFWFISCDSHEKGKPFTIAISKGLPLKYYGAYSEWLIQSDSEVSWVDLYSTTYDSAMMILTDSHGLLLSGGADIYPGRYGEEDEIDRCGWIDYKRDTLEFALIEKAISLGIPILGICRGEQILNVYHGGSLYIDIPTDLGTSVEHRISGTYECFHEIDIEENSLLYEMTKSLNGVVNSNHHQGIKLLGTGLRFIARTKDGLPESIQYKEQGGVPFMLGVQWHPEQLSSNSPFSVNIANRFILEARQYYDKAQ